MFWQISYKFLKESGSGQKNWLHLHKEVAPIFASLCFIFQVKRKFLVDVQPRSQNTEKFTEFFCKRHFNSNLKIPVCFWKCFRDCRAKFFSGSWYRYFLHGSSFLCWFLNVYHVLGTIYFFRPLKILSTVEIHNRFFKEFLILCMSTRRHVGGESVF